MNISDLKKMKAKGMVNNMNFTTNPDQLNCEICAKYKIHVQPFKNSTYRKKDVLGFIWTSAVQ